MCSQSCGNIGHRERKQDAVYGGGGEDEDDLLDNLIDRDLKSEVQMNSKRSFLLTV